MHDLLNVEPQEKRCYLDALTSRLIESGWNCHDALHYFDSFNAYSLHCMHYYLTECRLGDKIRVDVLRIQPISAETWKLIEPRSVFL